MALETNSRSYASKHSLFPGRHIFSTGPPDSQNRQNEGFVAQLTEVELVIVTPMRNEALNIANLSRNLVRLKMEFDLTWIVVDDSSIDNSVSILEDLTDGFPNILLNTKTSGRLIEGGAYEAWAIGVKYALQNIPTFTHIMKLDADVCLDDNYFESLKNDMTVQDVGIIGGVIVNGGREQNIHVPGPVKIYSRAFLQTLSILPLKPGFDVLDEVLAERCNFQIVVSKKSRIILNRRIGNSQGMLHGRRRNGMVCKWTGYYPFYFFLHLIRYLFRKPFIFGAISMTWGYFTAPPSPFPSDLTLAHANLQKTKIKTLLKNPVKFIKNIYTLS